MKNKIFNIFLNEKFILVVIVINALTIFLQESGAESKVIDALDVLCTIIFLIEMVVKHISFGFRKYWRSGWNCMDGILVLLSLPSAVAFFMPTGMLNLSFLLVLRVFRVFRFFRLIHAFPNFSQIAKNFGLAMRESYAVLLGLLITIFTFALLSCAIFRDAAPDYFSTPLDAIYSTFRLFTGEGWNEIPDTISATMGPNWGHFVKLYFSLILIFGGIIGMSLLNSIFVDAMVSDNNDDVKAKLNEMSKELDEIKDLLNKKKE